LPAFIEMEMTLENPFYAYLFGFAQTDGHLSEQSRNRGKLRIEIGKRDAEILERFKRLLPFNSTIRHRVRTTNFGRNYESVVWTVCDRRFQDCLKDWGFPAGKKSEIIEPPLVSYSQPDYFRGLLDGDGSLGLTANGFPLVSLVTSSPQIVGAYLNFVSGITGKKKTSLPNSRDKIHNAAIYKEDAQRLVREIYYKNCLALPRKLRKAKDILAWRRPATMKTIPNKKFWTVEEDNFISANPIEVSMKQLERSRSSIEMRLWRLGKIRRQLVTN
jgi:hypothetical protein